MATFVVDSFTGSVAALSAHTGETGATWTKHSTWTDIGQPVLTGSGRLNANNSGLNEGLCHASGSPASADYDVQANLYTGGVTNGVKFGVAARVVTSPAITAYVCYALDSQFGFQYVYLDKWVSGTKTNLGAGFTGALTGELVLFQCYDALKTVKLSGSSLFTTADNAITGAGKAGIFEQAFSSDSMFMDNFAAADPSAVAGSVARLVGTRRPSNLAVMSAAVR